MSDESIPEPVLDPVVLAPQLPPEPAPVAPPATVTVDPVMLPAAPLPQRNKDGAYSQATNPLRRPTWRWDRVVYLSGATGIKSKARRSPAASDDQAIVDGRKYLLHYQQLVNSVIQDRSGLDIDSAFSTAYVHWPDLSMAHRMYVNKTFARWAVEALVLAEQTPEDIAASLGCSPGVVIAYETYFYDVRTRRNSELFVMDALLSPALKNGATGGVDYDFLWKGLAYWYGAPVLKSVWSMGTLPDDMKQQLQACMQSMMDRNTLRATLARPVNAFNAHDVIDEHLIARQIEAKAPKENADVGSEQHKGAVALVEAIKLCVDSGLYVPPNGIEARSAQNVKEMAQGILNVMEDPIAKPIVPEKSAFDRPTGPPVTAPTADAIPVSKDLAKPMSKILQMIRDKKAT